MLTLFLIPRPTCSNRVLNKNFPLPRPISYCPPIFHLATPLLSIFSPASSPPQQARSWSDHLLVRRPFPPAVTTCLHFPPLLGSSKLFISRTCVFHPLSSCPPVPSLTCNQVPVDHRILPSGDPLLPLSVYLNPHATPPPLPASTGGPVPCRS